MSLLRPRDDQKARGVAIEPVDDPRPPLLPAPRLSEQPVHKRAAPVAGGRVHDNSRRLVHDEQVVVLVGNSKLDVLGLKGDLRLLGRQLDLQLLPTLQAVTLRLRASIDAHRARRKQLLGSRARTDLGKLREEAVQARARRFVRNAEIQERPAVALAPVAAAGARPGGRGRRGR